MRVSPTRHFSCGLLVQTLTAPIAHSSSHTASIIFLLLITAFAKTLLTAVTFGASIPAGIFLPSLTVGACVGRAFGIVMASLQRAHPDAWLFANCPADGPCISPPVYAVIGAASALGGVTRMTISLVRRPAEQGASAAMSADRAGARRSFCSS